MKKIEIPSNTVVLWVEVQMLWTHSDCASISTPKEEGSCKACEGGAESPQPHKEVITGLQGPGAELHSFAGLSSLGDPEGQEWERRGVERVSRVIL